MTKLCRMYICTCESCQFRHFNLTSYARSIIQFRSISFISLLVLSVMCHVDIIDQFGYKQNNVIPITAIISTKQVSSLFWNAMLAYKPVRQLVPPFSFISHTELIYLISHVGLKVLSLTSAICLLCVSIAPAT